MKKIIIWICSMIAIFFIVNTVGGIIVNVFFANTYTPALLGWSKRADTFIHPELQESGEKNKTNGLHGLGTRSLICNGKFSTSNNILTNFLFANVIIEESHIFFDKDGTNELSGGTFINVYNDTGSSLDHFQRNIGIIIVDDFCKLDGAKDFYKEIKKKEYKFRLDSYTIGENYVITPVEITVLDKYNNEVFTKSFSSNGEVIKAENIYFNENDSDTDEYGSSLAKKMDNVYDGMEKTGKIVNSLKDKAVFDNGEQSDMDTSFGIFTVVNTNVEVIDNKAMVSAICYNYYKGVIFYTVFLGIILTVIMFAISQVQKKKNQFY
ncbi:MAG: hypothetical protein IKJ60_08365 [Ruminococcus sp.]|nr:hypothetical protein [Ruminococcus sp.]